ncbi:multicopper oxidase family protein [Mesorhizobium sp.]|uniref:multicopper oxidase family protein n=1 Tax=Mesorhizobium sp. TaxID=1871066 RepID=UPI000FE92FC6|nr:multicopper oxidase family protein [Mesorhizobium sp.]RWA97368.1 MAG: multicopper oxidase family protein [Mesorhizobium sp.]
MHSNFSISRRGFLRAGACLAASMLSSPRRASASTVREIRIAAAPAAVSLTGKADTEVWAYDGQIPGPTLRLRQGEPVRFTVENRLGQDTTVHWHGIRLPNAMDGVPGLTQPPIRLDESFLYEFTPPDAGTFWYHPHANSLEQLGRGLAGALIVEEPEPVPVDRDLLWVLSDWRINEEGQIAAGFGNMMEAGMSGRVGNTVTLNGAVPANQAVRAGERIRLRLLNSSLARIMALRFEGHVPVIIARDGQPCDPHALEDGRLLLGPAMRIDLLVDMQGEPGRRYRITDDFYQGLGYELTRLAYSGEPPLRTKMPDPIRLPPNPLPEPELAAAERRELTLEGGMMSRMMGGGMMSGGGMMGGGGMMHGMGGMSGMGRAVWSINGTSMTGDGHAGMAPLFNLARGKSHLVTIRNRTAWWHPIHLHGFSFRVLARNGAAVPHNQWADTVLLAPEDVVEIAFVADSPGDWMLHCHVTDHQTAGLMTVLRVV